MASKRKLLARISVGLPPKVFTYKARQEEEEEDCTSECHSSQASNSPTPDYYSSSSSSTTPTGSKTYMPNQPKRTARMSVIMPKEVFYFTYDPNEEFEEVNSDEEQEEDCENEEEDESENEEEVEPKPKRVARRGISDCYSESVSSTSSPTSLGFSDCSSSSSPSSSQASLSFTGHMDKE